MSPASAISSEVFRFYLLFVAGLLGAAGAILALLRWGLGRNVAHAWDAWRGWVAMVPVVAACVFLGRAATIALFAAVSVFAFKEFARATGLYRDWGMTGAAYAGILALGAAALVARSGDAYALYGALAAGVAAALVAVPVVRDRAEGQLKSVALAVFGFVYVGWMFGHVAWLANSPHAYGYLLNLLLAVELNDVAAYTAGRAFGRHPLRPRVSPGKTWEGAAGGLAVSLALPWVMRFSLPGFSDLDCLLAGLAGGVGGQFGDLAVSVVKRDVGVKDMGAAIPGHGGLLDRIDSLAYAAPLFYGVVRLAHGA
jgi:phosphatidate cytidylyltransferase